MGEKFHKSDKCHWNQVIMEFDGVGLRLSDFEMDACCNNCVSCGTEEKKGRGKKSFWKKEERREEEKRKGEENEKRMKRE